MGEQFKNKVVLITGATGNLGSAVSRAFAAEGANLAMIDRDAGRVKDLATSLGLDEARYMPFNLDVTKPESVDEGVKAIEAKYGQIHALVHTVGGFAAGDPVHAGKLDIWQQQIALNATSVYVLGGRVAQHMLDHGVKGSISFVLAKAGLGGMKNGAAYVASKAAGMRIMESMALELKDHEIRVNGVLPSTIDTPGNRRDMPNADFSKWVTPDELAQTLLFLASDAASGVTGAAVPVYGRV